MKTWFTSDPHYGHVNIIAYANRPFRNVDEMNETLIQNWNSVVSSEDEVWILGDVCMGRLKDTVRNLGRLKGHKNLVLGNHDKKAAKMKEFTQHFERIEKYHEITVYDEEEGHKQKIILSHYPMSVWNKAHHGAWMLHGHCHGTHKRSLPHVVDKGKILDMGVDVHNFFPVSYEQLKQMMSFKKFEQLDHHGRR